jgi:hypothetical protein
MFCPKCGKELPDDSQFCMKCGHSISVESKIESKEKSSTGMLAWVLLGLVLLAGVVYGGVSWFRNRSGASVAVVAVSAQPKPTAPSAQAAELPSPPKPMSSQDIFQMAGGAVTLITVFDDAGQQRGLGSGFVVSSDGTAITNYHVIRGATRATARFSDGTESDVSGVLAYDASHDVAVVRLQTPPKDVLNIGDSDGLQVGEKVVAIGSPLGLENTLSEGIVSGMRNGIIQMSAPISPGSSGGPVLDSFGKVVGVSVAYARGGENLNFAVPINWAKPYLSFGNPRSFADIAAENTVTNDLVDGSISVPAAHSMNYTITYNPNTMSDADVEGQITSTGGLDGNITVAVLFAGRPIYRCRSTSCEIHQPLTTPGNYVLMVDNTISPMFGRTVSGKISVKYVK